MAILVCLVDNDLHDLAEVIDRLERGEKLSEMRPSLRHIVERLMKLTGKMGNKDGN